jgi:hypothetical protein
VIPILAAGVIVCLVGTTVVLFAVSELGSNIQQLRELTGFSDNIVPIDLKQVRGLPPSQFGLPADLDEMPAAAILVLSMKCGTCQSLAQGLARRGVQKGLRVLLECSDRAGGVAWLSSNGLELDDESVLLDSDGVICAQLGLEISPVAITIINGLFDRAQSVPSTRYLSNLVPDVYVVKG